MARTSAVERMRAARSTVGYSREAMPYSAAYAAANIAVAREPVALDVREAVLTEVDRELAQAGILDPETGKPSERIIAELSWERTETLPTPGILVKGCLDKCETCEPALVEEIALDLEHKRLKNLLLERQIELLEKSQEYRCCPADSEEPVEP